MREGVIEVDRQIAQTLAIRGGQSMIVRVCKCRPRRQRSILRLKERMWADVRQVLHIEHRRGPVVGIEDCILVDRLSRGNARLAGGAQGLVHSRYGKEILEVWNDRHGPTGSSHLTEGHSSLASFFQDGCSSVEVHAALRIPQVRRSSDVLLCQQIASKASEI